MTGLEIAVIGMSGRFPESNSIKEFWNNLTEGRELISFFTDEELLETGVDPALLKQENFVKARGKLNGIEYFDPAFFNYMHADAKAMDPQIRIFLECAYEALENSGYAADLYNGLIGIYAGAIHNFFWEKQSFVEHINNTSFSDFFQMYQLMDKDFLSTQVAYKLNLKGPAYNVQTACSTSLVAVHLACQGLLCGETDIALAGGVSLNLPQKEGYLYQRDMILSPDGHCRAFDAKAAGTVGGSGAGVVIMKRLEEAVEDGDHIYAVIKGSAINNDGNRKPGFTAPSMEGQIDVIRSAQRIAEISPESIRYVEAHGTGTSLGDPIEVEALKTAFATDKKKYCGLGSVKSNIGHLDAAAGVAGLIKTVLVLHNKIIPPSLHFVKPNPAIDFDNSPFYVVTEKTALKSEEGPLRACVSSFGIGGTNAHVILEEAPARGKSPQKKEWNILPLSAKSKKSLVDLTGNLKEYLTENKTENLSDVAYTLQLGRNSYQERLAVVADTTENATKALEELNAPAVSIFSGSGDNWKYIFMFPGQGSQYLNMGLELYEKEPVFRRELDDCFTHLQLITGINFNQVLYNPSPAEEDIERMFKNEYSQPMIFSFEYALARTLLSWGIKPYAMIGYSFGEYTAACLSGVFSLRDALILVAARGRLMGTLPAGAMLSVPLSEEELKPLLPAEISIAVVNGPSCLVSGSKEDIDEFEKAMKKRRCLCMRVAVNHAAHSCGMDAIAGDFARHFKNIEMKKPVVPYISNVTGRWISSNQACSSQYWVDHLKETVRFSDGVNRLLKEPGTLFLEVGSGTDLSVLIQKYFDNKERYRLVNFIRHPQKDIPDMFFFMSRIARLWTIGGYVDWNNQYGKDEKRHLLPLPKYPFDREHCWINNLNLEPGLDILVRNKGEKVPGSLQECCYIRSWDRNNFKRKHAIDNDGWLVFANNSSFSNTILRALKENGKSVFVVNAGVSYSKLSEREYLVMPENPGDYQQMFRDVCGNDVPLNFVHLWNVVSEADEKKNSFDTDNLHFDQKTGYHSLVNIMGAVKSAGISQTIKMTVVTNNTYDVVNNELLHPQKTMVGALCKLLPQVCENITCRNVDINRLEAKAVEEKVYALSVLDGFSGDFGSEIFAYRGMSFWEENFRNISLPEADCDEPVLSENGVYLFIGEPGAREYALAEYLAEKVNPSLVFITKNTIPSEAVWEQWLRSHQEDNPVSLKIAKFRELEKKGASVQLYDAVNLRKFKRVIGRILDRYGKINGIFYNPIICDSEGGVEDEEEYLNVLKERTGGLLLMDELLGDFSPEFFIIFSSMNAVVPSADEPALSVADRFLDSYCQYRNIHFNEQKCVIHLDDDWDGRSTSREDMIEIFNRVIGSNEKNVYFSCRDIKEQITQLSSAGASVDKEEGDISEIFALRNRLTTEYVEPTNDTEKTILRVITEVLKVNGIGIIDDLFELGADSLKAIQLIYRLEKEGIKIKLGDIFLNRNIKSLADEIRSGCCQKNLADTNAGAEKNIMETLGSESVFKEVVVDGREIRILYTEKKFCNSPGKGKLLKIFKDRISPEVYPHYIRSLEDKNDGLENGDQLDKKAFSGILNLSSPGVESFIQKKLGVIAEEEKKYKQIFFSNRVEKEYEASPIQKRHLDLDLRLSGTVFTMTCYFDIEDYVNSIRHLVKEQELLRSVFAIGNDDKLVIREYKYTDDYFVPFVDLTEIAIGTKELMIEQIIKHYFSEEIRILNNVNHRFLLIREDIRTFHVLFVTDHLLFDEFSIDVIKNYIEKDIERRSTPEKVHYSEYIQQVQKGPVDISEDEIVKVFQLEKFNRAYKTITDQLPEKQNEIQTLSIEIPLNPSITEKQLGNIPTLASTYFCLVAKKIFDTSDLPLGFVFHGRSYQNSNFFNTIGEFIDIIPIIVEVNNDTQVAIDEIVQPKIKVATEKNVNFSYILQSGKFDKMNNLLVSDMFKMHNLLLFNFLGKIDEHDLEIIQLTTHSRVQSKREESPQKMNIGLVFDAYYTNSTVCIEASSTYLKLPEYETIFNELTEVMTTIFPKDIFNMQVIEKMSAVAMDA